MENDIKLTPLHSHHLQLGAQMSPFAGYDMPIQYKGIVEEHNAVRNHAGVFDVSHMGEIFVNGYDAQAFVNHIFTNDISKIASSEILYGMMCHPDGGVVDDLLVYRIWPDKYLLVVNAANIDKDEAWLRSQAEGFMVTIDNQSNRWAQIALQGPESEQIMREVIGIDCSPLKFYTFGETKIGGHDAIISRTGYTGEDGFEIYSSPVMIQVLWESLMESGRVEPCGLGCRDTLRFEVGLPLYGDELADDITPLEAGLGYFVKLDKPDGFIGSDALKAQKAAGPQRKLVGLEMADRAIPRHGYDVLNADGEVVGHVTTGYRGISVDKSIAAALVDARYAEKGTELFIQIRKKRFPATVVAKKFYKKSYKS